MTLTYFGLFAIALLPSIARAIADASYTETLSNSTATSVSCRTHYDVTSTSSVVTHYSKKTLPPDFVIYSVTSTPYKTVTPPPLTSTSTSVTVTTTTTTLPASTSTFFSTSTKTDTVKETSTITVVSTHTVTTKGSTETSYTTVAAPSNFKSVDRTSGDHNYTKHHDPNEPAAKAQPQPDGKVALLDAYDAAFPAEVYCVTRYQPTYTIEVVKVHSTVKTTLDPSTSTTTVTSTVMSTSTVVPSGVSVTKTLTSTITTISTRTVTSTAVSKTTTTLIPTVVATSYAQCGAKNLLGERIGDYGYFIAEAYYTYDFSYNGQGAYFVESPAKDAYDCCAQCAMEGDHCQWGAFLPHDTYIRPNKCVISYQDGTCKKQHYFGVFYELDYSTFSDQIVFNGACGFLRDGGFED